MHTFIGECSDRELFNYVKYLHSSQSVALHFCHDNGCRRVWHEDGRGLVFSDHHGEERSLSLSDLCKRSSDIFPQIREGLKNRVFICDILESRLMSKEHVTFLTDFFKSMRFRDSLLKLADDGDLEQGVLVEGEAFRLDGKVVVSYGVPCKDGSLSLKKRMQIPLTSLRGDLTIEMSTLPVKSFLSSDEYCDARVALLRSVRKAAAMVVDVKRLSEGSWSNVDVQFSMNDFIVKYMPHLVFRGVAGSVNKSIDSFKDCLKLEVDNPCNLYTKHMEWFVGDIGKHFLESVLLDSCRKNCLSLVVASFVQRAYLGSSAYSDGNFLPLLSTIFPLSLSRLTSEEITNYKSLGAFFFYCATSDQESKFDFHKITTLSLLLFKQSELDSNNFDALTRDRKHEIAMLIDFSYGGRIFAYNSLLSIFLRKKELLTSALSADRRELSRSINQWLFYCAPLFLDFTTPLVDDLYAHGIGAAIKKTSKSSSWYVELSPENRENLLYLIEHHFDDILADLKNLMEKKYFKYMEPLYNIASGFYTEFGKLSALLSDNDRKDFLRRYKALQVAYPNLSSSREVDVSDGSHIVSLRRDVDHLHREINGV